MTIKHCCICVGAGAIMQDHAFPHIKLIRAGIGYDISARIFFALIGGGQRRALVLDFRLQNLKPAYTCKTLFLISMPLASGIKPGMGVPVPPD